MEGRLRAMSIATPITKQYLASCIASYHDQNGLLKRMSDAIAKLRRILNSVPQLQDDEILPENIFNQVYSLAQSSIKDKEPLTAQLFRKILSDLNSNFSNLNERSMFSLVSPEIWDHIFDFVSLQDIKRVRSTCLALNRAAFFKFTCPHYEVSEPNCVQWPLTSSRPFAVDISPNGKMIAVACDGSLRVYNMKGEVIHALQEERWISGLQFTKDNQSIAFYDVRKYGPHVYMWKMSEIKDEKINIDEHLERSGCGGEMNLALLSDGNMIVAIDQEFSLTLPHFLGVINPKSGETITSFEMPHQSKGNSSGFHPQNIQLSQNERLLAYELPPPYYAEYEELPPPILYIFNVLTGKHIQTIELEKNSRLSCFAFTHDNNLICCYHSKDHLASIVQLWDSVTGEKINKPYILKGPNDSDLHIHRMSVSGKHIALSGRDIVGENVNRRMDCILRHDLHSQTLKRLNFTFKDDGHNSFTFQLVFNKDKLVFLSSNFQLTVYQFPYVSIPTIMAGEKNEAKKEAGEKNEAKKKKSWWRW